MEKFNFDLFAVLAVAGIGNNEIERHSFATSKINHALTNAANSTETTSTLLMFFLIDIFVLYISIFSAFSASIVRQIRTH